MASKVTGPYRTAHAGGANGAANKWSATTPARAPFAPPGPSLSTGRSDLPPCRLKPVAAEKRATHSSFDIPLTLECAGGAM